MDLTIKAVKKNEIMVALLSFIILMKIAGAMLCSQVQTLESGSYSYFALGSCQSQSDNCLVGLDRNCASLTFTTMKNTFKWQQATRHTCFCLYWAFIKWSNIMKVIYSAKRYVYVWFKDLRFQHLWPSFKNILNYLKCAIVITVIGVTTTGGTMLS